MSGLVLHRRGEGRPVQFQHGLGGDHGQTFESFPELAGWELRTLDCRGHGASAAEGAFSIAGFAADVAGVTPDDAVIGGISMGAAIALRLAAQGMGRGLILVRPAWVTEPAPANMGCVAEAAAAIAAGQDWESFAKGATVARLAREAPDNILSLQGFFAKTGDHVAPMLAAIAADGPGVSVAEVAAIRVPALVCGCAEDIIHPMAHAEALARMIPGARLVELPPKGRDKAAHIAALHAAITLFLKEL